MSKKTKSSPLLKTLLRGNIRSLVFIFLGSFIVVLFDSLDVTFYSQIASNLDNDPLDKPKIPLLTSMILLLVDYFLYVITFRAMECYTAIFSFKLISQLDALIYDKLLQISLFNNVSEGALVNFIQSDSENFGEFFTYTPATLVQPIEILYFIYLLFTYFGLVFIFSIITLLIIMFIFAKLQKIRAKYQKEILIKKDKRMTTTTGTFEMISIVKIYSWEDYFLNKITKEREEELIYIKKVQIISLFIESITWSIGPILNFVSVFSYNLFNEPMKLHRMLTSLYIFQNLADPLFLIPEYVNGLIDSFLSLKRLEAFLYSKEYVPSQMVNINIMNDENLKNYKKDNKNEIIIRNKNKNEKKTKYNINNDSEIIKSKTLDNLITNNFNNIIIEKKFEKGKEIMIDIDNINFGIIKREEEFMKYEDEEEEEEEEENPQKEESVEKSNSDILIINDIEKNSTNKTDRETLFNINKIEQNKKSKNKNQKEKIEGTVIIPLLKGIKLKVKKGDLIGIIGEFGSGKTCLFNAILNNLDILNDKNKKIYLNGTVAYVPQKAWILNDTVRNNIIFNKPYNEEKYNNIVKICQLEQDFELFKQGDLTSISDKGDNLSGGQKIRLTIARAVYSDADIYLFDDPFSALDAYVGKNIFDLVIKDYLKGKTILIITHALQFIPMMDYIIKMNEGIIEYYGNVKDAENQKFYKDFISSNQNKILNNSILNQNIKDKIISPYNQYDNNDSERILISIKSSINDNALVTKKYNYEYHKPSKFEILRIAFSYSGGWCIFFLILFLNLLWKLCDSGSDFIITFWSNANQNKEKSLFNYYLLTKLISIIFIFVKSYVIVYALINYNRNIHKALLYRLLHGPINLFHNIVNKSHIINRFSIDMGNSIKYFWTLNLIIIVLFHIINGIFISTILFWKIIFIIPILLLLDYLLYNYYIKSAKGLNHLEIYTRVSLLSSVKVTLSGITSIRAYGFKDIFQYLYHKKLHDFYRVLVYQIGCSSWFALSIDLVCFCFLFSILVFIWFFKGIIGGGPLGIALSYILKLIEHSYNFFDYLNRNERMSTSMEACDAYTHIVQEAPLKLKTDDMLIRNNFPKFGKIEFVNYSVRYRPDTKLILKDINILIKPKEKIGIVGRTGSGKSTLCLCLFRILEATNGKILIDDIDISCIGLSFLRKIITVIPQDPTLIEGSLRENLDPSGKFDDLSMIDSLKSIGMDYILEEKGLDFMIKENGDNLSAGERQLICITRAMIRKSKIIIMDEATSSIDYDTEQLIQKAILNTLKDSTVITIAHRIKTILDYDRILVFEQGKLIEQGSPKELIENNEGHFFKLYSQSL